MIPCTMIQSLSAMILIMNELTLAQVVTAPGFKSRSDSCVGTLKAYKVRRE